jgi:hypothetical protein
MRAINQTCLAGKKIWRNGYEGKRKGFGGWMEGMREYMGLI